MKEVVLENSSSRIIEDSGSTYSKLVSWEVWNFMTLTHAKAEFDERNIVNFKGYNDSGKSAMLRALDVLMFNIKPNAQVGFIQDDKDYFRVMAYFDDGVIILRDKYINGQSLYEMYKDNQLIFTTKQNNHLTKVAEVPQPIQQYLGVIQYEGLILNSRSCFEKQLLVQTTGSENYKFLNSVLKSEEIAVASEALNTDKNKLLSDINTAEAQLNAYRETFKESDGVSAEMLDAMKLADKNLDADENKLSILENVKVSYENINSIPNIPQLGIIETERIEVLHQIQTTTSQLSAIPSIPELPHVEADRLEILSEVSSTLSSLKLIPSIPELSLVNLDRIEMLSSLCSVMDEYNQILEDIELNGKQLVALDNEAKTLASQMEEFGSRFTRCKNCGALVELGTAHTD